MTLATMALTALCQFAGISSLIAGTLKIANGLVPMYPSRYIRAAIGTTPLRGVGTPIRHVFFVSTSVESN